MQRSASAGAAVLLALAVGIGRAEAPSSPDGGPAPARDGGSAEGTDAGPAAFRAFAGAVTLVDWQAQKLTVEAAGRPVTMTFDRNTQVYLPGRLGTLRDLAPGVEVRVAQSPEGLAFWVEVVRGAAAPDAGRASDGGLAEAPVPDGGAARMPSPEGEGGDGGASAPRPPPASGR